MRVQQALEKLLQQQFEAHQVDRKSTATRSSTIRKKIKALELNHAMQGMRLQKGASSSNSNGNSDDDGNDIHEIVASILTRYVDTIMAVPVKADNQKVMQRIMDLLACVATTYAEATDAVVARATEFSTVLLERVRAQACQLLGMLCKHLAQNVQDDHKGGASDESSEWMHESLDDMKATLVDRLTDKSQSVRCAAIKATGHCFSAPSSWSADDNDHDCGDDDDSCDDTDMNEEKDGEEKDELLEALTWSVWHDPSITNRVAALAALPITQETLDHIIVRIRDVKMKVRIQALDVLRTNVQSISDLSKDQLADIVRSGLSTRCEDTKKATAKLICEHWMKSCQFDPILLLRNFDVIEHEDECEKVIKIVVEASKESESDALENLSDPEIRSFCSCIEPSIRPIDSVDGICDPTTLLFARVVLSAMSEGEAVPSHERERMIAKLVPDIPILCEVYGIHSKWLMEAIASQDAQQEEKMTFICLQLLHVSKMTGLQEEGSRRHFSKVMKSMLSSITTPDDLVEGSIEALRVAYGDDKAFMDIIKQIISSIQENQTEMEGQDDQEGTIDISCTVRILSIFAIVLENASARLATPAFIKDASEHVIPAVSHDNDLVREAAISCLGKLGMLTDERTLLNDFRPILLQVAHDEKETLEIRSQALLALSDWTMLFQDVMEAYETANGKTVSLMDIINTMIQHSSKAVVAIAAEVVAKLHFVGRFCDSSLLAKLVALYFDPTMLQDGGDDAETGSNGASKEVGSPVRLQQMLSLFFPAYCLKSSDGRDAFLECIEEALAITVNRPKPKASRGKKNAGRAKRTSTALPLPRIVDFVWSIVESSEASADAERSCSIDLRVLLQVAAFLNRPDATMTVTNLRSLCKLIGDQDLDLEAEETRHLVRLRDAMEDLGAVVEDPTALKHLERMHDLLEEIEEDDIEDEVVDDGSETETEDEGDDDLCDKENETSAVVGKNKPHRARRGALGNANHECLY